MRELSAPFDSLSTSTRYTRSEYLLVRRSTCESRRASSVSRCESVLYRSCSYCSFFDKVFTMAYVSSDRVKARATNIETISLTFDSTSSPILNCSVGWPIWLHSINSAIYLLAWCFLRVLATRSVTALISTSLVSISMRFSFRAIIFVISGVWIIAFYFSIASSSLTKFCYLASKSMSSVSSPLPSLIFLSSYIRCLLVVTGSSSFFNVLINI